MRAIRRGNSVAALLLIATSVSAQEAPRLIIPGNEEVSGIPCVRRVEIQIPMLNRSG